MTHIVALLTHPLTAKAVIAASGNFASRCDAGEIKLIHLRPDTDPDFLPTEEIYTEDRRAAFEAEQDKFFEFLVGLAEAKGQVVEELRGNVARLAAEAALKADIVILGAPHGDFEARSLLGSLLFRVKKPVLLVPRHTKSDLGRSIAIAWEEGNNPASRAVEVVNQLVLSAALTVVLLMGDGAQVTGTPEELLQRLKPGENTIQVRHFSIAGRHIGEALLAEAHRAGADLLVMGAFSHSRLREFLFGGATIEILKDLDLPVLMHH